MEQDVCSCGRLQGQVAIITGAAQGLGAALARRLAKEGCKVVVADLNIDAAEQVAAELPDAMAIKVDVTNEQDVDNMVNQTVERYGRLDLLVATQGL